MAYFPQMNFSQMHEHLRQVLLRRIEEGTLSVSLLARQTGLAQSHVSNFLRKRRQLSLSTLDRVLKARHMSARDLLPPEARGDWPSADGTTGVPFLSRAAVLYEPHIHSSSRPLLFQVPNQLLASAPRSAPRQRYVWERFVALTASTEDAHSMRPVIQDRATLIIDRHCIVPISPRPARPCIYAVRDPSQLKFRYVEATLDRLVFRPHNGAVPVDLLELKTGKSSADFIAGRVIAILNLY